MSKRPRNTSRKKKPGIRKLLPIIVGFVIALVAAVSISVILFEHSSSSVTLSSTTASSSRTLQPSNKLEILYVNQGNALVDRSNFSSLVSFAREKHFNTIFFQVYRSGSLLFSTEDLSSFVSQSHIGNLSIFFALYFTSPTQPIPPSIYSLGENGINLDMSTLALGDQESLLAALEKNYLVGKIAVTTTNLASQLKPNILILETYNFQADEQFVRPGIVAAIEPFAISSSQEYQQEFNYALSNSDGVMVFDYYGLLRTGF